MTSAALTAAAAPAGDANPDDIVRTFAANPAFRAATAAELTNENNPYRRSVRPDDLGWLSFAEPVPVERVLLLSGLLGHRILRNCHDAGSSFRPAVPNEAAARDAAHFTAPSTRAQAALAAPILERHLFGLLDGQREPLAGGGIAAVRRHVERRAEELAAAPGRAFDVALSTQDRANAATFVLVQLSAVLPAAHRALARHAGPDHEGGHPWLRAQHRAWTDRGPAYAALFEQAALTPAPVAYWQFFLSSSLGRANHLLTLARAPERFAEFLGAAAFRALDEAATAPRFARVLGDGLGIDPGYFTGLAPLTPAAAGDLVTELLAGLGEDAGPAFHAGFEDARWLAKLWDTDLATQLDWADQIPLYQEKAEKIDHKLKADEIDVDLDTFVETEEETSTTHVHDEHRLVIVERGQMHFWNNVGRRIALNAGDKLLIPTGRLHGSVVLSGSCTYHQPIIPEDLFAQF